jgi:hypothetical protein
MSAVIAIPLQDFGDGFAKKFCSHGSATKVVYQVLGQASNFRSAECFRSRGALS